MGSWEKAAAGYVYKRNDYPLASDIAEQLRNMTHAERRWVAKRAFVSKRTVESGMRGKKVRHFNKADIERAVEALKQEKDDAVILAAMGEP